MSGLDLQCFDCIFFEKRGLCCPKHATPEQRKAADANAAKMLESMPSDPDEALAQMLGCRVDDVKAWRDGRKP